MNISTLINLTLMPERRARELLEMNRLSLTPTADQARLEGAIIDRFPSLASGHTPGSVERAIEYIEPYERLLVVHPGPDLNIRSLAWHVVPSFIDGGLANGIPALRHGPGNRGVVLYQEGIDAAVVLAGVSESDWLEAVQSFADPDDDVQYVSGGQVTPEEAAAISADRAHETPYGSILARRIGALYALPHVGIELYFRTPGRVLEITQQERDAHATRYFINTLERAGLELIDDESNADHLTFLPRTTATGWLHRRAKRTGRIRTKDDAPLLVRLSHRPVSFPDVRTSPIKAPGDSHPQLTA
ncbi:hypothetical protein [Frondihabitans australicus]|uniref:Uncharacterized protein n=1 Tax=Frondihabitans australicus TaxID=386892 RepID=A0A495IH26_9MICO|nr:hypothetical protein [Frondihabitans australicus]RKR74748.1 hypothetical protein C8E83_1877 [Frondihabitans australicus]